MRTAPAALLVAFLAQAQVPVTRESIEVRISNVDVVVTDARGKHVHGLRKNDFELLDNGKAQEITNFAEYNGAEVELAVPQTRPAAAPQPPPSFVVPVPVSVLVFVDNLHLRPATRHRAMKAIGTFANEIPGARFMAATFNGTLNVQPSVANAELAASLISSGRTAVSSQAMLLDRRRTLEFLESEKDASRVYRGIIQYAERERHDIEATIAALDAAVSVLAGAEGRKILLYVSDGVPQSSAAELFRYYDDRFHTNSNIDALSYNLSSAYTRLAEHANASGTTFYTMDAQGNGAEEMTALDSPTESMRLNSGVIRDNSIGTLKFLASSTGGRAITDQNDLHAALLEAGGDLVNYYSLAYRTPATPGRHAISVKVKQPGLTVRHRSSSAVRSGDEKLADSVQASLFLPRAENPLDAVMTVGIPTRAEHGRWKVPISFRVPRHRLTLIPNGSVTFFLAVMDKRGDRSSMQQLTQPVTRGTGDVTQNVSLTIEQGPHILSVAIRDDAGLTTTYLRSEIPGGR